MADRAGAKKALTLLEDAEFRAAVDTFHAELRRLGFAIQQGHTEPAALDQLLGDFRRRWGVVPPHDYALFFPTQSEPIKAVLAGQWALIPVFPWTTESDVLRTFHAVRRQIEHPRAATLARRRRDRQAEWLLVSGFSAADIAQEVYGRKRGGKSRARLRDEALDKGDAVLRKYLAEGMDYHSAVIRASRAMRTEAPAAAQVRMAAMRVRKADAAALLSRLAPQVTEPLSGAVNALLRVHAEVVHPAKIQALSDPEEIKLRSVVYARAVEDLRLALLRQSHP